MTRDLISAEDARLWSLVGRTMRKRFHVDAPLPPTPQSPANKSAGKATGPRIGTQKLKLTANAAQTPKGPSAKPTTSMPAALQPTPPLADASGHKKVRRGKVLIEARMDLHGFTQHEAQRELARFIPEMRRRGFRCVLIITGKGRPTAFKSGDFMEAPSGVLRRRLPSFLAHQGVGEHISGYAPAHARHGGDGAFYVLLKLLD